MVFRVGSQRWQLFPRPQALWPLQEQNDPNTSRRSPERGLASSLLLHSGVGFCSMGLARGSSAFKIAECLMACGEVAESG